MAEPLSKEIIRKTRELAICGMPKRLIAEELGIGLSTVFKFAKGIHAPKKIINFQRNSYRIFVRKFLRVNQNTR